MTITDALRLVEALGGLLEVIHSRMGPDLWAPAWGAQAAKDIAQTENLPRADGTTWGQNPVATVRPVVGALIEAIIEHVDAVRFMLVRYADLMLPIETATRGALEAAAQASWLLDPRLAPRARVARLYIHRREAAFWLEKTLDNMGLPAVPAYGNLPTDLDDFYLTQLGLVADRKANGTWIGCEGQRGLGFTDRVAQFHAATGQNPAKGPYSYYSGAPHAMFWRVAQKYRTVTNAAGEEELLAWAPAIVFYAAVSACVEALWSPAYRAFDYMGRGAAASELMTRVGSLRAALRMP